MQSLIVDKAPMAHRCTFEAANRTLRDTKSIDALFGGFQHCCVVNFYQLSDMELEQTLLMPL